MRVVRLNNPFQNGFGPDDIDGANAVLEEYQSVYDAIEAGTAYIRFFDGDRKGSVARLSFRDDMNGIKRPEIRPYLSRSSRERTITEIMEPQYFWCVITWDGRRNKAQQTLPDREAEILLDYDGATVWEKFDAKAAKDEILKNPDQKDINGRVLSIGDRVLYINARYGSRMTLDEGSVTEFLVSANSKGHAISVVIESKAGEESNLQYPESMVYKL